MSRRNFKLPVRSWVVVDPDGFPCLNSTAWTRRHSIRLFISYPWQWRHNYRSGFRCVQVGIRRIKKGGRK